MKKIILLLAIGGTVLFLSALIISTRQSQKESKTENQQTYPVFSDDADEANPTPQFSLSTNEGGQFLPPEKNNTDPEYLKIYNNISGGIEKDRRVLADTLYKNGYRYNSETDIPIRFPSDDGIDHFTGMPLIRIPPVKIHRQYETDEEAVEEFEKNLQQREKAYIPIEPEPDMIPAQEAVATAMGACPVEFDANQKPKVNLIRDFYLIFLWEHRRPYTDGTYHVASIKVDAYSGEVRTVQIREDCKNHAE